MKRRISDEERQDMPALDRREFLRFSALALTGLAAEGAVLSSLGGCAGEPEWRPVSYPAVLLHNFRLFDGSGGVLRKGLFVLVRDGIIEAIERAGDMAQYGAYRAVDLRGMTLMPGCIDNHVHITVPFTFDVTLQAIRQMDRQIANNARSCVMAGVTTVRDVDGFPEKILKCREMIERGEIPGPRIISSLSPIAARNETTLGAPQSAPYFTNPVMKWFLGGNYAERPVGTAEIERACREMVDAGARWIKTLHQECDYSAKRRPLPNHSDEGYRKILEIGREHGIRCALHQPMVSGFRKGVELGFHTLEHMPLDGILGSRDIDAFMRGGTAIMPTIMAYHDQRREEDILALVSERGERFLTPEAHRQSLVYLRESIDKTRRELAEEKKGTRTDAGHWRAMLPRQIANLRKIHRMGGTVGMGTDNGGYFCGYFGRYADELAHFVNDAGISAAETLRMATSTNARILGMQRQIGSVERGLNADLIAVPGDPLRDIAVMGRVAMVMKGGLFFKAEGIQV